MALRMNQSRASVLLGARLLASASAMAVGLISLPAFAQTQTSDPNAPQDASGAASEDDNVIVVSGFRQAIQSSLNDKRNSDQVTDTITAEDVGKSTDQNIAEALQRVTGVSIDRSNGEGTTVTVRGINADLNGVTLNGVPLGATGGPDADLRNTGEGSNAVNFQQFSADLLSKIEVVKTASAEQDEGSLGASINLTSFKPLGVRKNRRIIDLQTRYAPLADRNGFNLGNDGFGGDYRLNVSLSEKLFDDTVGVALIATKERQSGRRDAIQSSRYFVLKPGGRLVGNAGSTGTTQPGGFTNVETGQLITGFDYDGDGTLDPLAAHAPFEIQYALDEYRNDRDLVSGTIQWQPSDTTEIQIDATFTQLDSSELQNRFSIRPTAGLSEGNFSFFDPSTYDLVGYRRSAVYIRGPGTGGASNPGYVRPQTRIEDVTEKNFILGFDVKQELGEFTFNLRGGRSRTTARDNNVIDSTFQIETQADTAANPRPSSFNALSGTVNNSTSGPRAGFYSDYDCFSYSACVISVDASAVTGRDPSLGPIAQSASEYTFGSFNFRDRFIKDTTKSIYFDVDWDHRFGPITSIEAGLKWSDRTKNQQQTNTNYNRFDVGNGILVGAPLSDFGSQLTPSNFGAALGLPRGGLANGWATYDPVAAFNRVVELIGPDAAPKVIPAIVNSRILSNEVYGGYLQANYELFDQRVVGNFGLRYVKTNVDVAGGASIQLLTFQFRNTPENLAAFGGDQNALNNYLGMDLQQGSVLDGVPTAASHSYDNWLPSFNANWFIRDDMILRFAASKTMARPPIDQLASRFSFVENQFNAQSFANGGNPFLEPFESRNLDLSFEWYFDKSSLLSVAFFDKKLSNFTRQTSELFFIEDLRAAFYNPDGTPRNPSEFTATPSIENLLPFDPNNQPANCFPNREDDLGSAAGQIAIGCDVVAFNTFTNGDGGYVRGVEVGFQHNFTYLPGLLSGLGIVANYTYSDSKTSVEKDSTGNVVQIATPFPQTSLHTFNVTGFYEKDGKLLRLAYNKRSDYLLNANILGGYAHYREGFDTLDLSASWQVTPFLQLNFQAQNLLDTVARDYAVYTGFGGDPALPGESVELGKAPSHRTLGVSNTGRLYRFGLRFNF